MTLPYGFVKATISRGPQLQHKPRHNEVQYHLHFGLEVSGKTWDVAMNVGTNDSDDLLHYKLIFDFVHPIVQTLKQAPEGVNELTGTEALPALDFQRQPDLLDNTGKWRESDPMDGSEQSEPAQSLKRLLQRAMSDNLTVYVFGRFYTPPGLGIHDTHMNQGSTKSFLHRKKPNGEDDDSNDHNDVWQDGGLLVDTGAQWAAYFSAFDQQLLPSDDLGNPRDDAKPLSERA